MFFHPVDLTTALRPSLLPDETLLYVQDAVGLYEGFVVQSVLISLCLSQKHINYNRKYKVPFMQDGHAYLTSHRVCYVDNAEPRRHSVAIELKSVEIFEFYV